jgi:hypothetical protein
VAGAAGAQQCYVGEAVVIEMELLNPLMVT